MTLHLGTGNSYLSYLFLSSQKFTFKGKNTLYKRVYKQKENDTF